MSESCPKCKGNKVRLISNYAPDCWICVECHHLWNGKQQSRIADLQAQLQQSNDRATHYKEEWDECVQRELRNREDSLAVLQELKKAQDRVKALERLFDNLLLSIRSNPYITEPYRGTICSLCETGKNIINQALSEKGDTDGD